MKTAKDVLKYIKDHDVKYADFRFTDPRGKWQHVTFDISLIEEELFSEGQMFDGSSIAGWKGIEASDMLLSRMRHGLIDPFYEESTLVMTCDVVEPADGKGYERDPRSLAKRAEAYLKSSGLGDTAFFGPEPEFFIFDSVEWDTDKSGASSRSVRKKRRGRRRWNSKAATPVTVRARRAAISRSPRSTRSRTSAEMCLLLEQIGIPVEVHHHEVGGRPERNRHEVLDAAARPTGPQQLKYIIHNVAHTYGKTATFMPKPVVGDNGSGMHVHQSIWKDGKNLFAGDGYAGLSEFALFYIGGIIKHARALNAITNPSTNSYKRLVPHFEAPVKLAYSARNRSASIRIPTCRTRRAAESKRVSRIRWRIRTCASRR